MHSLGREPQVSDTEINRAPEGRQILGCGASRRRLPTNICRRSPVGLFWDVLILGLTPQANRLPPLRGSNLLYLGLAGNIPRVKQRTRVCPGVAPRAKPDRGGR